LRVGQGGQGIIPRAGGIVASDSQSSGDCTDRPWLFGALAMRSSCDAEFLRRRRADRIAPLARGGGLTVRGPTVRLLIRGTHDCLSGGPATRLLRAEGREAVSGFGKTASGVRAVASPAASPLEAAAGGGRGTGPGVPPEGQIAGWTGRQG